MKYQENHLKLKHPVQYETGFFTTTPPSSLFSYAAFLDLPSHLDDTKMAAAARRRGGGGIVTRQRCLRPTCFIY